jgi:phosphoribosylaminoimidazolecarboxamide formyltransferase/IMP cyclohydrolase
MPVAENRSPVELRSALNPHQVPATVSPGGDSWPFEVANGNPSYTNLLDATHAWALARELDAGTGLPAAVSFKHVNPSGAAVAVPASVGDSGAGNPDPGDCGECETGALGVAGLELSPLALAYARARGANRTASYGDFVAVSRPVDGPTAALLKKEVSDGIIAPGFEPAALAVLSAKKSGRYLVLAADPEFTPPGDETRTEGGLILAQRRDTLSAAEVLGRARLAGDADGARAPGREGVTGQISDSARTDLLVAIAAAKWTVSNAVVLAAGGQVIGVGAGQQSRVEATRIACGKAETWWLRRHPAVRELPLRSELSRPERDNAIDGYLRLSEMGETERRSWLTAFTSAPEPLTADQRSAWLARLDGVAMASDGVIPFRDNIDRAARTGVRYVVHSGGSVRDDEVAAAAREHGITLLASGCRQFLH